MIHIYHIINLITHVPYLDNCDDHILKHIPYSYLIQILDITNSALSCETVLEAPRRILLW